MHNLISSAMNSQQIELAKSDFINSMNWSADASDYEKSLVLGNINAFAASLSVHPVNKALAEESNKMRGLLRSIAYPRRGTEEETMTIQQAADSIAEAFEMEGLEPLPA